jgi:hypothetical protein
VLGLGAAQGNDGRFVGKVVWGKKMSREGKREMRRRAWLSRGLLEGNWIVYSFLEIQYIYIFCTYLS